VNKKFIIIQFIIVTSICLFMETVSFFVLEAQKQSVGFFFNLNGRNEVNEVKGFGFNEIDPLCGWAMSNKSIESMGYETQQNCEVLRSKGDFPSVPLKIFITGGSTSNIALHKENWPNQLHQLFIKNKINAIIYAGGVGGFSSGQELLKLLRDGLPLEPDIHISYAGANDAADGGYVSKYEYSFYKTAYRESFTSPILPSTIFLIKKTLNLSYYDVSIKKVQPMNPFYFWKQNMTSMGSIAQKNDYQFIGILQPVLGIGKYKQANENNIDPGNYRKDYQSYYPKAKEFILKKDSSLYDFTNVFDTVRGNVFVDDCHINETYQPLIAAKVYNTLESMGYFTSENKER